METKDRRSLSALAQGAGVTPRTVRYYIAQGLLPGPSEAGPNASYDEKHAARLSLIRELQRQHLPLAEIRTRLASLTDAQVAGLLEVGPPVEQTTGSALDYVRSILGRSSQSPQIPRPTPMPAPMPRSVRAAAPMRAMLADMAGAPRLMGAAPELPSPPEPTTRSQWDRVALTPDIELHVRRPLSRLDNRRVERLITIARQLLREEPE